MTRILIQSAARTWKAYVEHDFVKQLAKGTLPKECFLHFIKLGGPFGSLIAISHTCSVSLGRTIYT